LIINKLKRTDSVFDKVKLLNENYFNTGRESLKKKKQDVILEVEEEENARDRAVEDEAVQLTTDGGNDEPNNNYFKNKPMHLSSGTTPKDEGLLV